MRHHQAGKRTFTEEFEYPELGAPVAARYRGYHRFDLTTCIACDQCAKACPVDCIYIGKERAEGAKGFRVTGYSIDYTKCMFCALCVEPCPVDCIAMIETVAQPLARPVILNRATPARHRFQDRALRLAQKQSERSGRRDSAIRTEASKAAPIRRNTVLEAIERGKARRAAIKLTTRHTDTK